MLNLPKLLPAALALTLGSSLVSGQVLLAFWDFNDDDRPNSGGANESFDPDGGEQAASANLLFNSGDSASGNAFQITDNGTTLNDVFNDPPAAGNAVQLGHGARWNNGTMTISFDATSVSDPLGLSFAANLIDSNGPPNFQASYSLDGGESYDDLGGVESFPSGWDIVTIDFGTVLSGAAEASVRLTFSGASQVWSTGHAVRLDNIALTAIPEPRVYAALFGLLALGFVVWRRRR